ncbi:helix-turn-helix domain-containing protein [Methylobacterium gossipiicola]|uniref:Transcriptional regulator, contains XRE-family HTH domain n=1 Tax=Methylobacterium gossipiicola TaxID=582675 RepID=A0A1I2VZ39_9HYPH|nr:helix-turn-helix transcriptional regulator [Methylobacterium gossipiicola]SFG92561.1 Transcriptional regulator, contains XRE-family HTH domain [Methylobacterium gossipiicola]
MTAPVSASSIGTARTIQGKGVTDEDRILGLRVSAIRKTKGLTQAALGEALGVTFQQVQKYEKGVNRIGAGRLGTIARFLGVSLSDLYGDEAVGGGDEALAVLNEPGATELLRLYAAIASAEDRRRALTIVREIAKIGTAKPAGDA